MLQVQYEHGESHHLTSTEPKKDLLKAQDTQRISSLLSVLQNWIEQLGGPTITRTQT